MGKIAAYCPTFHDILNVLEVRGLSLLPHYNGGQPAYERRWMRFLDLLAIKGAEIEILAL